MMDKVELEDLQAEPGPSNAGKQSMHSRHSKESSGLPKADVRDPELQESPNLDEKPTTPQADALHPLSEMTPRVPVGDDDYMRKYPHDEYGDEMGDNARVWKAFIDERDIADKEYIEDNNATLDGILVFASIFSAILTTSVTQTYQALLQDPQEASLSLLVELVALQRVIANGSSVNDIPSSQSSITPFVPSSSDVWLNSLWFVSLTLSLLTAFLGVLAKQWLGQYKAVTSGDARSRALVRQARYVGLHDWKVPELIGVLPVILHLSLGLFFAGLVILLRSILQNLAIFIAAVVGTVYVAYIVSNVLPIIYPRCPYRTALTPKLFRLSSWTLFVPSSDSQSSAPRSNTEDRNTVKLWLRKCWSKYLALRIPASKPTLKGDIWRAAEREDALDTNGVLEAKAVEWLYTSSYNPTAKRVVLEALAGSPAAYIEQYAKRWEPDVMSQVEKDLYQVCTRLRSAGSGMEIDRQLELSVRALSKIQPIPRDDFQDLGYDLVDRSRSPRLRATSAAYFKFSSHFFGELLHTEAIADIRLTTSIWLSLFPAEQDHFDFKSIFTILTVLRDVHFFGSDSPLFSADILPSTDLLHPNEKMCKAMHSHISRQSLAVSKHLDDDSGDKLPDALLRLLTLITANIAYYKSINLVYPPLSDISTKDSLEALDVTLDCLLQIVAKEKAHNMATTWSDPQKAAFAMITTTPLFKICETDWRNVLPPVRRRVFLKTMSLIEVVYKPADPLDSATIPFRSTMFKLLLQVYRHRPYAEGQPMHEYYDTIALLLSGYVRGDDLACEAYRTENVIPILCNNLLRTSIRGRLHLTSDLTFRRWNPKYPKHSSGNQIRQYLWSPGEFLDHYLARIPPDQERSSGSPPKMPFSHASKDKEYIFQPETLYCLCSALLLRSFHDDGHRMLIRLLKLKPDAESWIGCIQRLIKLPQSELSRYLQSPYGDPKERIGQLYRDIADMQSILGIDDGRLEDSTWKLTVNFETFKTSRFYRSLINDYRQSESSPEVYREVLATAAEDPEASPTQKRKWHDRLQRFNPFPRSRVVTSSSHELGEIVVDPQSAMSGVQRSASNRFSLVNADEPADIHDDNLTSAFGAPGHLGVGTTIERGKGNMSDMRSTSRIKEIEKGYGDNEEKKPELEDGEDGDELSMGHINVYASNSKHDGADNDHDPPSQLDVAMSMPTQDSPEAQDKEGKGPSNSDEVPDSERHKEVSIDDKEGGNTNNVALKRETHSRVFSLD